MEGKTNTDVLIRQLQGAYGELGSSLPIGSVISYAGSVAPTGWIICDGSAISRTAYSSLFAAIGTSFGSGDGSTTFNVPDLRGRAPYGKGTNTDNNALGENDGVSEASRTPKHTLDVSEIPAHTHTVNNTISYSIAPTFAPGAQGVGQATIDSGSAGGGGSHNHGFIVVNFIIKAFAAGDGLISGQPTGPAGGVLAGDFPDPSFAVDMATQAELDAGLAGKAATSHSHAQGDVTDLIADLAGKLDTAGDTMTGQLILPNGSAATPSARIGDAGLGPFRLSANTLGIAANSATVASFGPNGLAVAGGLAFTGALRFPYRRLTAANYNFLSTGENFLQVAARAGGTTIVLPQLTASSVAHVFIFLDPHGYFGAGGNITVAPYDDGIFGFTAYDTINGVAGAGAGGADFAMNATGGIYLLAANFESIEPLGYAVPSGDWTCKQIG